MPPKSDPMPSKQLSNIEVDRFVKQSIMLRDRIRELEDDFKLKLEPFKSARDKVNGTLLAFLDATGQTSARTDEGTVTASVRHTASLGDPDKFMDYVMKNGLFELLERRANATACRDHAEEHDGKLPPGVNISAYRYVNVRAPHER